MRDLGRLSGLIAIAQGVNLSRVVMGEEELGEKDVPEQSSNAAAKERPFAVALGDTSFRAAR